jgi:FemAB family protein
MRNEALIETIATFGCTVRLRSEAHIDWNIVQKNLAFKGIMEADHSLQYQKAYFNSQSWNDLSLVCYKKNGIPCGIISLHLREIKGLHSLCAAGLPIEPIQFLDDVSTGEKKRICRAVLRGLKTYHASLSTEEFKCHAYSQLATSAIDEWGQSCLELAQAVNINHQLYIDLEKNIDDIKSAFRKSYKPLINKAMKLWEVRVLEQKQITISEWQKFKKLHFFAANNRKTRSDESWEIQYLQVLQGNAFLIALYSEFDKLIGGGFFQYTQDEGMYSVAAYDRTLFDQPVGHLVQWTAINELKRLGLKKYLIGTRPYATDVPSPSQKELNIGYFKEGFSNSFRIRYLFSIK